MLGARRLLALARFRRWRVGHEAERQSPKMRARCFDSERPNGVGAGRIGEQVAHGRRTQGQSGRQVRLVRHLVHHCYAASLGARLSSLSAATRTRNMRVNSVLSHWGSGPSMRSWARSIEGMIAFKSARPASVSVSRRTRRSSAGALRVTSPLASS